MFSLVEKDLPDSVDPAEEKLYAVVCERKYTQQMVEMSKLKESRYKLVRNLDDKNQILMSKNLDFKIEEGHTITQISTKDWPRKRSPPKRKIELENVEEHMKILSTTNINSATLRDPKLSKVLQFCTPQRHIVMQVINNFAKMADFDQYYLTGLDLYLYEEPCVMCSMALVHSRINQVFYAKNLKFGGLGSRYSIHVEKSLNHHFLVWKLNQIDHFEKMSSQRESNNEEHSGFDETIIQDITHLVTDTVS